MDDDKTCDEVCNQSRLVEKDVRTSSIPVVHYGTIASGNLVVKHGITRENMRQRFNCICLEMESAGLLRDFPCAVIRDICDYADSHKGGKWKRYASATASAYAKELLSVIPPHKVHKTTIGPSIPSTCLIISEIPIRRNPVALGRLVVINRTRARFLPRFSQYRLGQYPISS